MTTKQLLIRLLRYSPEKDPAKLSSTDAILLLDAVNDGLAEYYETAPVRYSQTTISTTLTGPKTTTVAAVNGSHEFADGTFLDEERGRTVRIGDDPGFNEILSPTLALDSYRGATGTVTATIWGDAVALKAGEIKRVIGSPRLDNGRPLLLDPGLRDRQWRSTRSTGAPSSYFIDPVGEAGGGKEIGILRVSPMPDREYTLRLEVEIPALALTDEDLVTTRDVPMADQTVRGMLLPLCFDKLQGTRFWNEIERQRIASARQRIAALAQPVARPHSRVLTPRGW